VHGVAGLCRSVLIDWSHLASRRCRSWYLEASLLPHPRVYGVRPPRKRGRECEESVARVARVAYAGEWTSAGSVRCPIPPASIDASAICACPRRLFAHCMFSSALFLVRQTVSQSVSQSFVPCGSSSTPAWCLWQGVMVTAGVDPTLPTTLMSLSSSLASYLARLAVVLHYMYSTTPLHHGYMYGHGYVWPWRCMVDTYPLCT
jgi:hypothetical protein